MKHPASRLLGIAVLAVGLAIVIASRASAPAGRYTIANGTVYDTKTKLTWQQVVSFASTQAAAATYCSTLDLNGVTWRLPAMKELLTIVDNSVPDPGPGPPALAAIDSTAFPATPVNFFWSSTPYAGASGNAWDVSFWDGSTEYNDVSVSDFSVRCVR